MKLKIAAAHKPGVVQAKRFIKMALAQGEVDEQQLKQKLLAIFSPQVLQQAVQQLIAEGVIETVPD